MRIKHDVIDEMNANSLYRLTGIRLESAVDGTALSELNVQPATCWPFANQPHGGIMFTLMDTTMAWAIQSNLESGLGCATIDLNVHYTMPARGDIFYCRAETIHQTGRLSFVRADISNPSNQIVATGQAAFRIIKMDFI